MMTTDRFHHAILFREDVCIGCSHCMGSCPTEAIRVRAGKARMHPDRCIDCGECFRVCPVGAIIVDRNDFELIKEYPVRVLLIPSVFTGQFPDSACTDDIFTSVRALGFTHVYEVEESVGLLAQRMNAFIHSNRDVRPLISSFCPAVVRLIQVRFPTLTPNLVPLMAPVEITAMHARRRLDAEGIRPDKVGVFYATPCAAKIVAVQDPQGEDNTGIDGVIPMNQLYNKVYKILRERQANGTDGTNRTLPGTSVCWSLTQGESDHIGSGRSLAIDEINNVIEFLEKVENEEITGVDFLELRACDESCAGGILCPGNRFLTAERLRRRASGPAAGNPVTDPVPDLPESKIRLRPIKPRSILKLDDNVALAMVKMKRIYELNGLLPQVDCGICGAPTCKALAGDIVRGEASLGHCIFVQKILERNEKFDPEESVKLMRSIWSESKIDRNAIKAALYTTSEYANE